jgi:hypothetical protein
MFAVPLAAAAVFLAWCAWFTWLTREPRKDRIPLARLADPRPLPGEFPADPDKLLLASDIAAAGDALELEISRMCWIAEREFGRT